MTNKIGPGTYRPPRHARNALVPLKCRVITQAHVSAEGRCVLRWPKRSSFASYLCGAYSSRACTVQTTGSVGHTDQTGPKRCGLAAASDRSGARWPPREMSAHHRGVPDELGQTQFVGFRVHCCCLLGSGSDDRCRFHLYRCVSSSFTSNRCG